MNNKFLKRGILVKENKFLVVVKQIPQGLNIHQKHSKNNKITSWCHYRKTQKNLNENYIKGKY